MAERQNTHAFELWCWRKLLESPLDSKEVKPVHPKGNQHWIFTASSNDANAEAPILWSSVVKSWFIRKDPDAGKDWSQEDKGMKEEKMVVWHYQLKGHEFEQAPGDGEGQGSLTCCSQWDLKKLGMTEGLNNNNPCFAS